MLQSHRVRRRSSGLSRAFEGMIGRAGKSSVNNDIEDANRIFFRLRCERDPTISDAVCTFLIKPGDFSEIRTEMRWSSPYRQLQHAGKSKTAARRDGLDPRFDSLLDLQNCHGDPHGWVLDVAHHECVFASHEIQRRLSLIAYDAKVRARLPTLGAVGGRFVPPALIVVVDRRWGTRRPFARSVFEHSN